MTSTRDVLETNFVASEEESCLFRYMSVLDSTTTLMAKRGDLEGCQKFEEKRAIEPHDEFCKTMVSSDVRYHQ